MNTKTELDFCKKDETDWDLIGDHYNAGSSIKLIIKKR